MIILDLLKIIILCPFIVDFILAICKFSLKKRGFLLTPLYIITLLVLLLITFPKAFAISAFCIFLAVFMVYVLYIVKQKYRKVYPKVVIRTSLTEFHAMFFNIYLILVVIGSIYLAFV